MSLTTFSKFYYGQIVDGISFALDFSEGGPELAASIPIGDYTLSSLILEVKTQMDAVGGQSYEISVDRDTRLITISAPGNFELLVDTGTREGSSVYELLGFTGADRTGSNSYTGDSPSGSEYVPQFILQDHIASENFKNFIDPEVNVSSSGEVEVVKFGNQEFIQMNIKYATDEEQPKIGPIRNNPTGLQDLRDFMDFAIEKNKLEYMPDRSDSATFETVLLEKTPEESKGTGYKLKELYNENLPLYFDTGILLFRKVN